MRLELIAILAGCCALTQLPANDEVTNREYSVPAIHEEQLQDALAACGGRRGKKNANESSVACDEEKKSDTDNAVAGCSDGHCGRRDARIAYTVV